MDMGHEIALGYPKAMIAGVDEAGRGSWAGPVVAAAIILTPDVLPPEVFAALDDSKKISPKKRAALFTHLQNLPHGIGISSVAEIDRINILQASLLAMKRAVEKLPQPPAHILVDGNRLPDWCIPATAIIKGDSKSPSIAAASILAKVSRDTMMVALAHRYPVYGWARNKGYGAPVHKQALAQSGVSPHHRRSYAPIRHILSVRGRGGATYRGCG